MAYIKKQKGIIPRLLQSLLFRLLLLLVFIFLAMQVYEQYVVMKKTIDDRIETEAKYSELKKEKVDLANRVTAEDNEYNLESEIRKNFDMQKEGEQVVIILEDSKTQIPERQGPEYPEESKSSPWYIFWD